jgi:hypothetical protein
VAVAGNMARSLVIPIVSQINRYQHH